MVSRREGCDASNDGTFLTHGRARWIAGGNDRAMVGGQHDLRYAEDFSRSDRCLQTYRIRDRLGAFALSSLANAQTCCCCLRGRDGFGFDHWGDAGHAAAVEQMGRAMGYPRAEPPGLGRDRSVLPVVRFERPFRDHRGCF